MDSLQSQNEADTSEVDQDPDMRRGAVVHTLRGIPIQINGAILEAVQAIESEFDACVWFLATANSSIEEGLFDQMSRWRDQIPSDRHLVVIVQSFGGQARPVYRLARLFQQRSSRFTAVVPRVAKSAATLFCTAAADIYMAETAELGPLDVQVHDPDRETRLSALDEVQAIERLHIEGLKLVDTMMFHLSRRSGKRLDFLLPLVLQYTSNTLRPGLESLDVVHYTSRSRILKVGEEYAQRLLTRHYDDENAAKIARRLVGEYFDHSFVIDSEEAQHVGLKILERIEEVESACEVLADFLEEEPLIGPVFRLQLESHGTDGTAEADAECQVSKSDSNVRNGSDDSNSAIKKDHPEQGKRKRTNGPDKS